MNKVVCGSKNINFFYCFGYKTTNCLKNMKTYCYSHYYRKETVPFNTYQLFLFTLEKLPYH